MPTILELFHSSGLRDSVKADTETLIEQETSGIRVKSAVDINNPLIYGNEATRIAIRSTPILEKMKDSTGGTGGDGGLIGGKITEARDFINSKIGIPETLIPTKVSEKIIEIRRDGSTSADPITVETFGKNGSDVGKFLKQSGGGNPKTILKQAVGGGITKLKDKARKALFGDAGTIGEVAGDNNNFTIGYSNKQKYQDVVKEEQTDDTSDGIFKRINLSSLPGRVDKEPTLSSTIKELNSAFSSENLYSKDMPTLESLYGMGTDFDTLNADGKEGENFTRKELEDSDLIPIWIAAKGGKSVHFRSIISGLTETVTPSWSSQKFLGNPYNFYNYEGVERGISFNLKMFCYSKSELANMWTKIQFISKNCYPDFENIEKNKVIKPPIIEFRIGNIYKSKVSFIESLSYTIPDDSNWETIDGLQLPKIVEVAIGIKFIENAGIEDTLYAYEITEESLKIINEKRGTNSESTSTFSEEPQTNGDGASPEVVKLDNTGVEITEETEKQKDNSGINKPPKDAKTGQPSAAFFLKSQEEKRREKNRKDLLATGKILETAWCFNKLVSVRKMVDNGRWFGYHYDTLVKESERYISIVFENGNSKRRKVFDVVKMPRRATGTTGMDYEKWKKDQAQKQEIAKEYNVTTRYGLLGDKNIDY